MNEFELFGKKKDIELITLPDAKAVLERGLKYFIGEQMQWLPEYDEVCSWLADNKRRGLMLFGSNGRGKTQICHNIMPVLLKHYLQREYLCVTFGTLPPQSLLMMLELNVLRMTMARKEICFLK